MPGFKSFRIRNDEHGYRAGLEHLRLDELMPGEVLLECHYSSVNYKDALAGTGRGKVVRRFPLNGGIDAAGRVLESADPRFAPGDPVLATGYGLGVSHDGGFAERLRLPADWLVPMPAGLDPYTAMALGTAGFTAGLALARMERNGLHPGLGPVLVTGASGGVGNVALALLARNGYEAVALTGKAEWAEALRALGASRVIGRPDLELGDKPLDKGRWAGLIDSLGGDLLAGLLTQVLPGGGVACIGNAAGVSLNTTVLPFILRGISLLGIDSVECPQPLRDEVWERLARQLERPLLERLMHQVISLEGLPDAFETLLAGGARGRILVKMV